MDCVAWQTCKNKTYKVLCKILTRKKALKPCGLVLPFKMSSVVTQMERSPHTCTMKETRTTSVDMSGG